MRTKILIGILLSGVMIACKKDGYNTKPTLKIKSISTDVVPMGGSLTIEFEVTDKEGDVTDTANLFQRKIRLNSKVVPVLTNLDSLHFIIPKAPNSQDGLIELNLGYSSHLKTAEGENENDTIMFKYALRDLAGNTSDTISTGPIVVIR